MSALCSIIVIDILTYCLAGDTNKKAEGGDEEPEGPRGEAAQEPAAAPGQGAPHAEGQEAPRTLEEAQARCDSDHYVTHHYRNRIGSVFE